LAAGPEHRSGLLPLLLGSNPNRFSQPPAAVLHFFTIAHAESHVALRIVNCVFDNSVVLRIEPGHNRVVIWKGLARKRRSHPFRAHSLARKLQKVWRLVLLEVIVTKAIKRDEYHRGLKVANCSRGCAAYDNGGQ